MGIVVVKCIDRGLLTGDSEDTRCCASYQTLALVGK